jgi:hypothetical protein
MQRMTFKKFLMVAVIAAFVCAEVSIAREKPASWKVIDDALFRVNDAPVKLWGVYQTGRKRDPLLVQMNNRFLVVKIHERQIFEIDPKKVRIKPDELLWDPADHPSEPLAMTDWDVNDTEAVFLIRAKLTGEDHLLDIELPHQLDLSGMSPHAASSNRRR